MREFSGLIYIENVEVDDDDDMDEKEKRKIIRGKIDAFEKEYQHWMEKYMDETFEPQKEIYKSFADIAKLQADKMRLENNQRPESREGIQILNEEVDNSDLGRLERFKRWSKDNLLGLSALSISIAGILTIIIIRSRKALKQGAKAVGNLAKSLANIAKNFGAVISSLLNLVSQALLWGSKGIAFLSKNLWMLVLAFTFFLYNEYKERREKNKYI